MSRPIEKTDHERGVVANRNCTVPAQTVRSAMLLRTSVKVIGVSSFFPEK